MDPNLLALLRAAALARVARPNPLAAMAPRIGAPPSAAPAMRAPHPQAAPHPHAHLPLARAPHEALRLPRGARFRTPDGRVKVRP